jgi:hypothetical protein
MNSPNLLHESASELAEAARTFKTAAGQPGSHAGAVASLDALEEALQVLSAAWSQLAIEASPGMSSGDVRGRRKPPPRGLMSTGSLARKRFA